MVVFAATVFLAEAIDERTGIGMCQYSPSGIRERRPRCDDDCVPERRRYECFLNTTRSNKRKQKNSRGVRDCLMQLET